MQPDNVQGSRSLLIGGCVGSRVSVTGDRNVVQQDKYNLQIDRASGLTLGDEE